MKYDLENFIFLSKHGMTKYECDLVSRFIINVSFLHIISLPYVVFQISSCMLELGKMQHIFVNRIPDVKEGEFS